MDEPSDSAMKAILESLAEDPSKFKQMACLRISVTPCSGILYGPLTLQRVFPAMHSCSCGVALSYMLLAHTRSLTFLSIDVEGLEWLPSFLHALQHLQIRSTMRSIGKMMPEALNLQTLRTLCLERNQSLAASEDAGVALHLNLEGLSQLDSVMLDGVTPASLILREGTTLHVVSHSLIEAQSAVWHNAIGAMRSFTIKASDQEISSQELPGFLLLQNSLISVMIMCNSLGTIMQPLLLQGPWLQLKRLALRCEDNISIVIGDGHLAWQQMLLCCNINLHMRLVGIPIFAERCTELIIWHGRSDGDVPALAQLLRYLKDQKFHVQDRNSMFYVCDSESDFAFQSRHPLSNSWISQTLYTSDYPCECGACWKCCRPETCMCRWLPHVFALERRNERTNLDCKKLVQNVITRERWVDVI